MAECIKYKVDHLKICVGDMTHRIEILERAIQPPSSNGVDFEMQFTPIFTVWSTVKTKSYFLKMDKTNIDKGATHEFGIWYRNDIDATTLFRLNDEYYQIANMLDPEERHEILLIAVIKRGTVNQLVNYL